MSSANPKVRTPELCCDIIESIMINCSCDGASFSKLERYLILKNKGISKLSLKLYLFYLIDHGYLSYGKVEKGIGKKNKRWRKYSIEPEGFNLMHLVYEECMLKGTTVDCVFVAFERAIANYSSINNFEFR